MEQSTYTDNQNTFGDLKQAAKARGVLHYIFLIDEQQQQQQQQEQGPPLQINVIDGEDVFSIALKVKNENIQIFHSVDTSQMIIYESTNQEAAVTPIHPFYVTWNLNVTWNPNVTWGTAINPLIVQTMLNREVTRGTEYNPLIVQTSTTTTTTNNGKSFVWHAFNLQLTGTD